MITTELMVDTIHASERVDPKVVQGVPVVGGYVTGTSDILWTPQDWADVGAEKKDRIWQGYGAYPGDDGYDEIDIETGAVTPEEAAAAVKRRVDAGITWTNLYGGRGPGSALRLTAAAIQALGEKYWIGHVTCRLADWSLSRIEAQAIVGTFVEGMTCMGVQWASPTSNPNTVMPGPSGLTLKQANCDLSVVDVNWVPSKRNPAPTPPPPAVTPKAVQLIVKYSDGSVKTLPL